MTEWRDIEVSEDILNDGRQYESDTTKRNFWWGDRLNEYWSEVERYYENKELYFKKVAHGTGGNWKSYKDIARICAGVSEELRVQYDMLTFNQFRACLSGESLEDTLEWAVKVYPETHGGRIASYRAIYDHTQGRDGEGPEALATRRFFSVHKQVEIFMLDDRLHPELREMCRLFLQRFSDRYREVYRQ